MGEFLSTIRSIISESLHHLCVYVYSTIKLRETKHINLFLFVKVLIDQTRPKVNSLRMLLSTRE